MNIPIFLWPSWPTDIHGRPISTEELLERYIALRDAHKAAAQVSNELRSAEERA
jgi:hypothetical protein